VKLSDTVDRSARQLLAAMKRVSDGYERIGAEINRQNAILEKLLAHPALQTGEE
jgi:hypothetical protein